MVKMPKLMATGNHAEQSTRNVFLIKNEKDKKTKDLNSLLLKSQQKEFGGKLLYINSSLKPMGHKLSSPRKQSIPIWATWTWSNMKFIDTVLSLESLVDLLKSDNIVDQPYQISIT
jgi:hypothetical protein